MNEESDPMEQRIIDAVQRELKEFGTEIADRFAELQQFAASETDARTALEARVEELTAELAATSSRIDAAATGVEERVERFDEERVELSARLDRLDRRRNEAIERLDVVDERLGGIDEIVGEATVGISDRVEELGNAHEAFTKQMADELEAIRTDLSEIDSEAMDEVKEQVSGAVGEAELIRIEMERFQEKVKKDLDSNVSRLVAVETMVQDSHMDVEAAAQLERLEEVERMVLMLDPELAEKHVTQLVTTVDSVDDAVGVDDPAEDDESADDDAAAVDDSSDEDESTDSDAADSDEPTEEVADDDPTDDGAVDDGEADDDDGEVDDDEADDDGADDEAESAPVAPIEAPRLPRLPPSAGF